VIKAEKKILITEDEPHMLRSLAEAFAGEFSVFCARDGQEGLSVALRERPDIILLDISMPKMDGMTMMAKLRADNWGKNVPIVLLTNLSADDKIMAGITRDMPAYYLVKDQVTLEDIKDKVKERLTRKT
jgi:two-component system, response regulator, stage 0 sporulation protein A